MSLVLMIPLRRARTAWLLGASLGFFLIHEFLAGIMFSLGKSHPVAAVIGALLIHGGKFPRLIIAYPVIPWLAMMILGYVFGKKLMHIRDSQSQWWTPEKVLLIGGTVSLLIFGIVRGLNSYGNMLLYRVNGSLIQWLHV